MVDPAASRTGSYGLVSVLYQAFERDRTSIDLTSVDQVAIGQTDNPFGMLCRSLGPVDSAGTQLAVAVTRCLDKAVVLMKVSAAVLE